MELEGVGIEASNMAQQLENVRAERERIRAANQKQAKEMEKVRINVQVVCSNVIEIYMHAYVNHV